MRHSYVQCCGSPPLKILRSTYDNSVDSALFHDLPVINAQWTWTARSGFLLRRVAKIGSHLRCIITCGLYSILDHLFESQVSSLSCHCFFGFFLPAQTRRRLIFTVLPYNSLSLLVVCYLQDESWSGQISPYDGLVRPPLLPGTLGNNLTPRLTWSSMAPRVHLVV